VDIEDLVPRSKLRMPYATDTNPRQYRGTQDGQVPPSALLADSVLWIAALNGRVDSVRALLEARKSPASRKELVEEKNALGKTALFCASERGQTQVVRALLESAPGASVDAPDLTGRMPLHAAAAGGHLAVALALLEKGANRAHQFQGETASNIAARLGYREIADLLQTS